MPKDKSTINFLERLEMDMLEVDWCAPEVFPDLTQSKYIAVDLETCDPNLMSLGPGWARGDGFIVGVAVAAGDFNAYYPIAHQGGGNLGAERVIRWLKKQMATPHIPKVFHNATYDLGWLRYAGVAVEGKIIDTMIAAPLLDENRFSYSLNNLGRDYLGDRKNEKMLRAAAADFGVDPKADMWKLPAKYVGLYAEQDAALTLKLWNYFESELQKNELTSIFELETSLIPLMLEMRARGVRVNVDKAELTKRQLVQREKEIVSEVKRQTGILVEPWVATSVASVLGHYGLECPKTDSGQPSITKAFLQACSHEIAGQILKLRELNKANSTFVDSILRYSHNSRIHCEFNQLRSDEGGTVTGRFSSSNPNLQQIPARDPEIKSLIRGLFVPEEGEKWGSFDYSSQEPRLLVHYCSILNRSTRFNTRGIDDIVSAYRESDVDFHQMVADMAGISRKEAKTVNLGIMYGMGQGKLANTLDITVPEAKELLDTYHSKVPFVKSLASEVSKRAQEHGQIRTLLGRKCRFDMWEPASFGYNKPMKLEEAQKEYGPNIRRAFTYKALNKLIQGSAADQTKKAMADCYAEGLIPLLTVHDELCFSINSEYQASRIKEIMETCVDLEVPSKVDQELGQNWGEVG
jgi:DNA polymerase I-like protein with 3'-5' exonuclease and polymerase domains